jgi:phage gp29-like protein
MGIRDIFTRRQQFIAAPTPPRTSGLVNDQAVDDFVEMLIRLPEPDEILIKSGKSRADLRALMADDEIGGAMETRVAAVHSTAWRLEPLDGQVIEFVWEELEKHIEPMIDGAFAAVPYGYSVIEMIYKRDGERMRIERASEKPFEWFLPQRDGSLRYVAPAGGPPAGDLVDTYYKFLLTRRRPTYRQPQGDALLSRLYWPWYLRSQGWRFWARFLERFGSPMLLGKTPGDTKALADALSAAVQSASLAVGSDDSVEAIAPGADGGSFDRFHVAVDKRIQKVILGQTLTTDTQGVGSQALGNVHDLVRKDRRSADLRMIAHTINQAVHALVALNFPAAEPPVFSFDTGTDLGSDRAERDVKLVQAGVKFSRQYFLDRYDLEEEHFDIEQLQDVQPLRASAVRGPTTFAARFTPGQDALEDLADTSIDQSPQPIPPGELRRIIAQARDPDDLINRLADAVDANLETSAFRELVERSLFAADLMGYAHADDESRA